MGLWNFGLSILEDRDDQSAIRRLRVDRVQRRRPTPTSVRLPDARHLLLDARAEMYTAGLDICPPRRHSRYDALGWGGIRVRGCLGASSSLPGGSNADYPRAVFRRPLPVVCGGA